VFGVKRSLSHCAALTRSPDAEAVKRFHRCSIALILASTIALAACATSSHVLVGTSRPAIAAVSAAISKTSTMSDGSAVDLGVGSSTRLSEFVRGLAIYVLAEGGTFFVPVTVNGTMTLDFSVDSGMAEVTIPADVFATLRRTGTIAEADLLEPGE
jgi:hypothetical protein